MKFATAGEHHRFFQENQFIEFDEILKPKQLSDFASSCRQVLANRLSIGESKVLSCHIDQILLNGRDLWRDSSVIRQITCSLNFVKLAKELFGVKDVRIGYDQLIQTPLNNISPFEKDAFFKTLSQNPASLEESSSIQGILGGLILCLADDIELAENQNAEATPSLFPKKAGQAVFFSSKTLIDYPSLVSRKNQQFLLVAYCQAVSVYIQQPKDLFSSSFKKLGYSFGDRLSDKLNPVIR